MMDESDFDIIKCPLEKCPFYHLMLCEGYKTEAEAKINMKMFIAIHNQNTKEADCQ